MDPQALRALLRGVAEGSTKVEDAEAALATLPFEDLGFAQVDHHRHLRTGVPEVIYGPGKTAEQVAVISSAIAKRGQTALVTRIDEEKATKAIGMLEDLQSSYEPLPRFLIVSSEAAEQRAQPQRGTILVVCAGTSDLPVAEEAARTAEIFGHTVERITDVGVAGLQRLLAVRDRLEAAEVVIVVAGMEGALPSVVKGLISRPTIAVPTSVGFGSSFQGLSALLGMLNSCSAGLTVVNIDNGFGAGYAAALINTPR